MKVLPSKTSVSKLNAGKHIHLHGQLWRRYPAVAVLSLLSVMVLLSSLGTAANKVTDDEIYDKVRIQLANDRDVKGGAIEVKVQDGVVQLDGNVRDEKQKSKAEKVAKKVKGVRQVVNQLKVSPAT